MNLCEHAILPKNNALSGQRQKALPFPCFRPRCSSVEPSSLRQSVLWSIGCAQPIDQSTDCRSDDGSTLEQRGRKQGKGRAFCRCPDNALFFGRIACSHRFIPYCNVV